MREIKSKSGKKITIRDITLNDVDSMFEYITDIGMEDTYVHVNPESMITYEEEITYVADCVKKVASKRMVKLLAFFQSELIGIVDITVQEKRMQHIGRLGITVKKSYRGDGIGKKLMETALEEAEKKLKINQIILGCYANNTVGLSMYKDLGFKEYGRLPKGIRRKEVCIDEVLFYKEFSAEQ